MTPRAGEYVTVFQRVCPQHLYSITRRIPRLFPSGPIQAISCSGGSEYRSSRNTLIHLLQLRQTRRLVAARRYLDVPGSVLIRLVAIRATDPESDAHFDEFLLGKSCPTNRSCPRHYHPRLPGQATVGLGGFEAIGRNPVPAVRFQVIEQNVLATRTGSDAASQASG